MLSNMLCIVKKSYVYASLSLVLCFFLILNFSWDKFQGEEILDAVKSSFVITEQSQSRPHPIELGQGSRKVNVSPDMLLYEDLLGESWSIESAKQAQLAQAAIDFGEIPNLGITMGKRYWGHFEVYNQSDKTHWFLQIQNSNIDRLHIYTVSNTSVVSSYKLGRYYADALKNKLDRFNTVPLIIDHNETLVVYFTVDSTDAYYLPVYLYDTQTYLSEGQKSNLRLGVSYGVLFCAILIGISLLITLQDLTLVYYTANWIFVGVLTFSYLDGLMPFIIPFTDLWWHREFFPFVLSFGMVFFGLFSRNMIRKDTLYVSKTLENLFKIAIIIPCFCVFSTLLIEHTYNIVIISFLISLDAGILFYSAIWVAVKGGRESLYYTFATGPAVLGGLIYGLVYMAAIPAVPLTIYAWHTGMTIEAVLLPFVLGRSILSERRAKVIAQSQALQAEQEVQTVRLHAEIEMKKQLELKVKERTQDLSQMMKELERHNIELTELSINDPLTKVNNRHFFNDRYPTLWEEAIHDKVSISVIMVDADHFKAVNDNYGHLMGDQCLRMLGEVLQYHIKGTDMVACRYGGEEFILLAIGQSLQESMAVAENIRKDVESLSVTLNTTTINITVSLGVACTHPHHSLMTMNDLVDQCDKALYLAKERGRNKVVNEVMVLRAVS